MKTEGGGKTTDYQKITLRGTISERAVFHRRLFQSESFTTFKVKVNTSQGSTTFPIIAYGQAAVSAGTRFRVGLRIMIVGEIRLNGSGKAAVIPKFWRYGRLADER